MYQVFYWNTNFCPNAFCLWCSFSSSSSIYWLNSHNSITIVSIHMKLGICTSFSQSWGRELVRKYIFLSVLECQYWFAPPIHLYIAKISSNKIGPDFYSQNIYVNSFTTTISIRILIAELKNISTNTHNTWYLDRFQLKLGTHPQITLSLLKCQYWLFPPYISH